MAVAGGGCGLRAVCRAHGDTATRGPLRAVPGPLPKASLTPHGASAAGCQAEARAPFSSSQGSGAHAALFPFVNSGLPTECTFTYDYYPLFYATDRTLSLHSGAPVPSYAPVPVDSALGGFRACVRFGLGEGVGRRG